MSTVETTNNWIEQWISSIINIAKEFWNTPEKKSELEEALKLSFDSVLEELKWNAEFKNAVCDLLGKEGLDGNVRSSLESLAGKLNLEKKTDWSRGEKASDDVEGDKKPQLKIIQGLEGVEKKDNENPSYWKGIIAEEKDDKGDVDVNLKLFKTKERINWLKTKVEPFLADDKLSTQKTHFRFFFLSSRFKRNWETV